MPQKPHNHDSNWHFHLIFYDRPCRRINQVDVTQLKRDGHDVSRLKVGDWDFSLRFPVAGRKGRWNYLLRRNKDRKVIRDDYIQTLRNHVAKVTNTYLAAAGVVRRVDAGTYADMGLEIESQEHLGAKSAVSEGKGVPTAAGSRNEEKQHRLFLNELAMRRAKDRAAAALHIRDLRAAHAGQGNRAALRDLALNVRAAIDWEYQAAHMKVGSLHVPIGAETRVMEADHVVPAQPAAPMPQVETPPPPVHPVSPPVPISDKPASPGQAMAAPSTQPAGSIPAVPPEVLKWVDQIERQRPLIIVRDTIGCRTDGQ